jgi:hypothetical protein
MHAMLVKLASELRMKLSLNLNEAERDYNNNRMTDREWRAYNLFWTWACARYSGDACRVQAKYARKRGLDNFWHRVDRFQVALAEAKRIT